VHVLDLPPTTASVPVARRFVRARLEVRAAEGVADVDTATLLVSEVVTNAVLHARSAVPVAGGKVVWFEVGEPSPAAWGAGSEHRLSEAAQPGRFG
jgi:hypothetical protein